ncbi:UNVERIFIED_CONTAM: hypothetical protein FKN15_067123 [Acipenser sinensis]
MSTAGWTSHLSNSEAELPEGFSIFSSREENSETLLVRATAPAVKVLCHCRPSNCSSTTHRIHLPPPSTFS